MLKTVRKKVAIKDVAKLASVSTATVSRYLNGQYHAMSLSTRMRIEETIKTLGYVPSNIARSLRSTKSKIIGVIISNILNSYSVEVLQGIEETCSKFGYNIIVCNTHEAPDKEREFIEMLLAKGVDGFVINTTGGNDELISDLANEIPVVLVGRKVSTSPVDTIFVNNAQGIKLAAKHLFSKNCRFVRLLIESMNGISPRIERVIALKSLSHNSGSNPVNVGVDVVQKASVEAVATVIDNMTRTYCPQGRLGVITGNGLLSLLTLKAIKNLGLRIPKDFLLVSFDDPDWVSVTEPSLTAIVQPTYCIGKYAVERLLANLNGDTVSDAKQIGLDVKLVVRDSTSTADL